MKHTQPNQPSQGSNTIESTKNKHDACHINGFTICNSPNFSNCVFSLLVLLSKINSFNVGIDLSYFNIARCPAWPSQVNLTQCYFAEMASQRSARPSAASSSIIETQAVMMLDGLGTHTAVDVGAVAVATATRQRAFGLAWSFVA